MQNTCSQLALSLKISCFHFSPERAAHVLKSLSRLPGYGNWSSRRCTSSRHKLCSIISSDHLSQCNTTHTASKRISFHVYVKGCLLAKIYIIVHNVKFSHNIKRKIIFFLSWELGLYCLFTCLFWQQLRSRTQYTILWFFRKPHTPNQEMLKEMNHKTGPGG